MLKFINCELVEASVKEYGMKVYLVLFLLLSVKFSFAEELVPYFYKATKGQQTVYMLGSLHIGIPASDFPDYVFQAINTSELFLAETDSDQIENAGYNSEKSFKQELINFYQSEVAILKWNNLVRRLQDYYSEEEVDKMEMWRVVRLLSYINEGFELNKFPQMDKELFEYAKTQGIRTEGLVSLQEHLQDGNFLHSFEYFNILLSPNDQKLIKKRVEIREKIYRFGLFEDLEEDVKGFHKVAKRELIDFRNLKWLDKIISYKDIQQMFIVFGAMHLAGDHGMLLLMEEEGYEIERIGTSDCLNHLLK